MISLADPSLADPSWMDAQANKHSQLLRVGIPFIPISTIAILIRFWSRLVVGEKLWWDDLCTFGAWVDQSTLNTLEPTDFFMDLWDDCLNPNHDSRSSCM